MSSNHDSSPEPNEELFRSVDRVFERDVPPDTEGSQFTVGEGLLAGIVNPRIAAVLGEGEEGHQPSIERFLDANYVLVTDFQESAATGYAENAILLLRPQNELDTRAELTSAPDTGNRVMLDSLYRQFDANPATVNVVQQIVGSLPGKPEIPLSTQVAIPTPHGFSFREVTQHSPSDPHTVDSFRAFVAKEIPLPNFS